VLHVYIYIYIYIYDISSLRVKKNSTLSVRTSVPPVKHEATLNPLKYIQFWT